ncbi:MAG: DUF1003 domain-containing protein [Nitrolancea sp.]
MSSPDPGPTLDPKRTGARRGLREEERRIIEMLRRHGNVARNVEETFEEQMSVGDRMADRLAELVGSWSFILTFLALIAVWVVLNATQLLFHAFDPYPYILLNLFLSLLAGIQAPVIMMSQNRQEDRDRLHAENDYEVNLKAELEIEQLHGKMDELRQRQWQELLEIQDRQIQLLHQQIELLQGLVGRSDDEAQGTAGVR